MECGKLWHKFDTEYAVNIETNGCQKIENCNGFEVFIYYQNY